MSTHPGQQSVHRLTRGAQLTVAGRGHQVDFVGDTTFTYDPELLRQFEAGAVSTVPLVLQADACEGAGVTIGEVTWAMDPERVPPAGSLSSVSAGHPFPAVQEHLLNITLTIPDLLPGITLRNTAAGGPLILRNANAITFPPENDAYELVRRVELEDVGKPGPVLATLDTFPTIANPLSQR